MVEITYILNAGQPVLLRGGAQSSPPRDSVGFAFEDTEKGIIVLHKHGEPERVRNWVANMKAKYSASDGLFIRSIADRLKFIEISVYPNGFPVMLVNEAIAGSQRALRSLLCPQDTIEVQARVVEESVEGGLS